MPRRYFMTNKWDLPLPDALQGYSVTYWSEKSPNEIKRLLKQNKLKKYRITDADIGVIIKKSRKYKKYLKNPTGTIYGGSLSFVNDLMFSKKKRK